MQGVTAEPTVMQSSSAAKVSGIAHNSHQSPDCAKLCGTGRSAEHNKSRSKPVALQDCPCNWTQIAFN
jgi:hypothetical protein